MATLKVTFGRALGNIPVLVGANCRSEEITIAATADTGDMVCDSGSHHQENAVDLYAGADCWVSIGATPDANVPGSDPIVDSFFMASGERTQRSIVKGDKVSVVAAA